MKNDVRLRSVKLGKKTEMCDGTMNFEKTIQDSAVTYRHSVGELRQGGIDWRRNVKFVGSVQLSPKREKAHCWLSQQAFRHFTVRLHSSGQMVVKNRGHATRRAPRRILRTKAAQRSGGLSICERQSQKQIHCLGRKFMLHYSQRKGHTWKLLNAWNGL